MKSRTPALVATLAITVLLGHLTDITTGQPLSDVRIALSGSHARSVVTDDNGAYRFAGVTPGTYTLTISSDAVPPEHRTVKVGTKTTTLDIQACNVTLDYTCASAPQ